MPQTREHFDICRLLDVRTGLVVITKIDLVEAELLSLVRAEAEELVEGSFLQNAPVIQVSSRTGAGIDDFRLELLQLAERIPDRDLELFARLPIDRAFSMKGFGAVVTGTLTSGEIFESQELEVLPGELRVRARGLQVHGSAVQKAVAGQRTAVNLSGTDVSSIQRGMTLAPLGRLDVTQALDVRIDVLPSAPRALRSRSRVRVHVGAAEVLARIHILEIANELAPGAGGFVQLRLEGPVVSVPGDRFIVRSYSPSVTIAGGLVLDAFPARHRPKDAADTVNRLQRLFVADRTSRIAILSESAGVTGLTLKDLAARTGYTDEVLKEALSQLIDEQRLISCESVFLTPADFERLSSSALEVVELHHKREPLARGLARETLRERVFSHIVPEIFRSVLRELERSGRLIAEKDYVRTSEHNLDLSGPDAQLRDRLEKIYTAAGLEAPSIDEAMNRAEVPANSRAQARRILQLLIDAGVVLKVEGDLFFHAGSLTNLRQQLLAYGDAHEPDRTIDVGTFKTLANISRKYAIPLLEYFDRERVTQRQGEKRVILRARSAEMG